MKTCIVPAVALTLLLTGCQQQAAANAKASQSPNIAAVASAWTAPNCTPPTGWHRWNGSLQEMRGNAAPAGAQLWALLFEPIPIKASADGQKIVWRMTGTGDLHVVANGPGGQQTLPAFLTPHGGSNWNRPGDEWGTGIVFATPGCWEVHLWRNEVSGSASFLVQ